MRSIEKVQSKGSPPPVSNTLTGVPWGIVGRLFPFILMGFFILPFYFRSIAAFACP